MMQYLPIILTVLAALTLWARTIQASKDIIPEQYQWILTATVSGLAILTQGLQNATSDIEMINSFVAGIVLVIGFAQKGSAK